MSMGTAIKQQKKVPELRFSGFDENWDNPLLSEITSEVTYGLTVRPEYIPNGIPLISAREIRTGVIKYDEAPKISDADYNKLSNKAKPKKGDLFLTKTGTIGFSAVVEDDVKAAITQNIAIIRPKDKEQVNVHFLLHQVKTSSFQKKILSKVNQSTIMDLQLGDIKKTEVWLPKIEEQQKIADFLGSVDAWLDNLRQQKTAFETYKRGMMQKLFTQQVSFKDDSGKDFPSWTKQTLGDHIQEKSERNKTYKTELALSVSNKHGFVIQEQHFNNYRVASKDTSNYKLVRRGDFAFNPSRINVGSIALLIEHDLGIVSPMYVVFSTNEDLNSRYLLYYTSTHHFSHLVKTGLSGSVRDSLSFEALASFELLLPSVAEQQKIADFLIALDQTITAKAEEITQVEQWKKGLMQKMFV